MKVIFCHGKEGSPNGTKATYLKERFDVIAPDLYRKPLAEQVEIVTQLVKENPDCILVGSSMGGAAARRAEISADCFRAHGLTWSWLRVPKEALYAYPKSARYDQQAWKKPGQR